MRFPDVDGYRDLDWMVGAAEAALIADWQSARARGDEVAAARGADFLMRTNVSLVRRAIGRYRLSRLDREDVAQAARLGLMQALARFDPVRGRFAAYATHWTRKEAERAVAAGEFSVSIPAHLPGRLVALRSLGSVPDGQAAESLDLSQSVVAALRPVLDAIPLPEAEGGTEGASPIPSCAVVDQDRELAWAVDAAVRGLPEDLRWAVVLTHGLDGEGPRSARQVARALGVSDFTIRARLARAHRILARRLSELG